MKILKFKGLSSVLPRNDGANVRMTFETDGAPMTVEIDHSHVEHLLAHFAVVTSHLARSRGATRRFDEKAPSARPIIADAIALTSCSKPDNAMLVVRFGDCDLGFEVSIATITDLSRAAAQLATTLSADHKTRPS